MPYKDISNKQFGHLTALEIDSIKTYPSGQKTTIWKCSCSCGKTCLGNYRAITTGRKISCGHLELERQTSNTVTPNFSEQDSDLQDINWHRHNAGYAVTGNYTNGKVYAHRLVLERKLGRKLVKGELCDHINRNKLDNRRDNLRVADKSINSINRDKRPDNTSGYVGVYLYWPKEYQEKGWNKMWKFTIHRKGYPIFHSKYYKTVIDASNARKEKLKEYDS